jgi:uncharacterized protein (DUF433 family)
LHAPARRNLSARQEHKEHAAIDPRLQNRIVRDPAICGGEPIVRGTRVTSRVIIASLAERDSPEEIVAAFPSVCSEDVRAAIAFVACDKENGTDLRTSPPDASCQQVRCKGRITPL